MKTLPGQVITIVGAGLSGLAAARLAHSLGASVRITDQNPENKISEEVRQWVRDKSIPLETGTHTKDFWIGSSLIVTSPGVRRDNTVLKGAAEAGIPVIGEIELAWRFCRGKVVGVTGSNGKTTVAHLITRVINEAGSDAVLCGNVGYPFSRAVLEQPSADWYVLELSSFQLDRISDFRPHIALFLNFSQNHLDWHQDLDDYFATKSCIFKNQTENDYALLNAADIRLTELALTLRAKTILFNKKNDHGNPNFEAVKAVSQVLGVSENKCDEICRTFRGVEHRLENVAELDGVTYINDSKSTTAEAGRWALSRIQEKVLMLCGGRDKNIDFNSLGQIVQEKVRRMFVYGEAREKLLKTFKSFTDVELCVDMADALHKAHDSAKEGETILLSPMCTSFDAFANFEERGRVFKELVQSLESIQTKH